MAAPHRRRSSPRPGRRPSFKRLPALLETRDVRILAPAYGEYARVFAAAGIVVREVAAVSGLAGAGLAIIVNPNNPDGRLLPPAALSDVIAQVGTLVLDEAFADVLAPEAGFVPHLPATGAIVLRSFGKFYGLAGLRLGFALGEAHFAARLRDALGPWAVSGPAIAAGIAALSDETWAPNARATLRASAARLDAMLAAAGLDILGGTPLFRLARHARAQALFFALARAGILVRPFAHDPGWLRFGLPGDADAWERLAAVLSRF